MCVYVYTVVLEGDIVLKRTPPKTDETTELTEQNESCIQVIQQFI